MARARAPFSEVLLFVLINHQIYSTNVVSIVGYGNIQNLVDLFQIADSHKQTNTYLVAFNPIGVVLGIDIIILGFNVIFFYPNSFSSLVILFIITLASAFASFKLFLETVIPILVVAVSGTTVTFPSPVTVNKSCFWVTTEVMGIPGPHLANTNTVAETSNIFAHHEFILIWKYRNV